jgi:hypothetical protein
MKCSCTLGLMAALVLGSPAAVEAQTLFAQPEILVSTAGFQPGDWEARLAVGPDGGILNSWIYDGPLKIRAVSPAGDPLGTTRQLSAGFQNPTVWHVPATGARGHGTPVSRTSDTGTFWFFDPANLELVVKVLDGTGINGHFWVFYGSLTDVKFKLTVTDRLTGRQRIYQNPAGTLASHSDTQAFPQ